MRWQPSRGSETATEYAGMRQAGELRADTYNLLLSMMSVKDIVQDIVKYKRMFMTTPNHFFYWPENVTTMATPEDYQGNFTFKAVSQYKMSREIERKQLIEAMSLVFGNQAFLPFVVPRADQWLGRLLDYFGIRDTQQLFANPQEQMMEQMMMTLTGGMQSGGQQPALGEKEMRMPESSPNPMLMGDMGNLV